MKKSLRIALFSMMACLLLSGVAMAKTVQFWNHTGQTLRSIGIMDGKNPSFVLNETLRNGEAISFEISPSTQYSVMLFPTKGQAMKYNGVRAGNAKAIRFFPGGKFELR